MADMWWVQLFPTIGDQLFYNDTWFGLINSNKDLVKKRKYVRLIVVDLLMWHKLNTKYSVMTLN